MTTPSAIADWVVAAGLAGDNEGALLEGFCRRVLANGVKLARAAVIIDTLHPVYEGRVFRWRREDSGGPELIEYGPTNEGQAAESWRASVLYQMLEDGSSQMRVPIAPNRSSGFPQKSSKSWT